MAASPPPDLLSDSLAADSQGRSASRLMVTAAMGPRAVVNRAFANGYNPAVGGLPDDRVGAMRSSGIVSRKWARQGAGDTPKLQLSLRLGRAADYIRRREWRFLLRLIGRALYSDSLGLGIRVDLTVDQGPRSGPPDHPIRPATAEDLRILADPARGGVENADELWQRRLRRHVASVLGPDRCFVADVEGVGPSFMQYLFFAEDNTSVQALIPGMYPVMAADEAMVEFLYVTPETRRYGLAVRGMIQVIDEARRKGARSVVSFIRPDDKGAIFVCQSAGFKVDSLRRSRNRLFRQSITFEPRPPDMSEVLSRHVIADGRR